MAPEMQFQAVLEEPEIGINQLVEDDDAVHFNEGVKTMYFFAPL